MLARIATWIAVSFTVVLVFASPSYAASPNLGFAVRVVGAGFFLNPLVTRVLVTEVKKASLAEAAGMRAGDKIIKIEGQSVVGRRARELQPLMNFKPGETRSLRLQHADGTEFDARFTNPKG
jgi:C-terminal processing protease CtpA/Prc